MLARASSTQAFHCKIKNKNFDLFFINFIYIFDSLAIPVIMRPIHQTVEMKKVLEKELLDK
jgi:hypothetical protein